MKIRRKIIGVIGSHDNPWTEFAVPLGKLIAQRGYHLLTGCGGGVMSEVSKAFVNYPDVEGEVIGIHPVTDFELNSSNHTSMLNTHVTITVFTRLSDKAQNDAMPYSLNYVNILSSDAIVVLPGAHGTKNETSLSLLYKKPVILYGADGVFREFPSDTTFTSTIGEVDRFLSLALSRHHGV